MHSSTSAIYITLIHPLDIHLSTTGYYMSSHPIFLPRYIRYGSLFIRHDRFVFRIYYERNLAYTIPRFPMWSFASSVHRWRMAFRWYISTLLHYHLIFALASFISPSLILQQRTSVLNQHGESKAPRGFCASIKNILTHYIFYSGVINISIFIPLSMLVSTSHLMWRWYHACAALANIFSICTLSTDARPHYSEF